MITPFVTMLCLLCFSCQWNHAINSIVMDKVKGLRCTIFIYLRPCWWKVRQSHELTNSHWGYMREGCATDLSSGYAAEAGPH